ncbi:MAG: DUF4351 domain-containing protein, partial [Candidatus Sericytochromatia bacterium]
DKERRLEYEASLKAYRDLDIILNESFEKGEKIGIEKGKLEGLKLNLLKLLTKKFGDIPIEIEDKILSCNDISKIDLLLDNIFDISSFEEINKKI